MTRWLRPEVYPLVGAMTFVGGMVVFSLTRHLFVNPDVKVNKANRATAILDNAEEGEKYVKHGFRSFVNSRHPGVPGIFPSPINEDRS